MYFWKALYNSISPHVPAGVTDDMVGLEDLMIGAESSNMVNER